jgi:hypothetical protein
MSRSGLFLAAALALTIGATTTRADLCGNGVLDDGESCDPPGSITCPTGSPAGSFLACRSDCTCPAPILDHFRCYGTRGHSFPSNTVSLVDQFVGTQATVVQPGELCNPAQFDDHPTVDPTAHLTCYKITEVKFARRQVTMRDEFGELPFTYIKPKFLCVPSMRDGVPSALNLDHFKCYKAKSKGKFTRRTVMISDDEGDQFLNVIKPSQVCNPVNKNGEGVLEPDAHLTCYKVNPITAVPLKNITVQNQFGGDTLRTLRGPNILCMPSVRTDTTPTTTTSSTVESTTTSTAVTTTSTSSLASTTTTTEESTTTTTEESTTTTTEESTTTTTSPGSASPAFLG